MERSQRRPIISHLESWRNSAANPPKKNQSRKSRNLELRPSSSKKSRSNRKGSLRRSSLWRTSLIWLRRRKHQRSSKERQSSSSTASSWTSWLRHSTRWASEMTIRRRSRWYCRIWWMLSRRSRSTTSSQRRAKRYWKESWRSGYCRMRLYSCDSSFSCYCETETDPLENTQSKSSRNW